VADVCATCDGTGSVADAALSANGVCPVCDGRGTLGLPEPDLGDRSLVYWAEQGALLGVNEPHPQASLHIRVAGHAYILFHHDTGRVELRGFATPDAAARAFWDAVARLAPPGWRLETPAEGGEGGASG
jgi:hypothetical protein